MATIRKRGNSWHVQVRRAGYPTLTRSFHRKSAADAWARRTEADADRRALPADPGVLRRLTLGDLLTRYRDTVSPTKRGVAQERDRINQFLREPIASANLAHLSSGMFAQYRDRRLQTVCGGTVRRELAIFRRVIEVARKEWDIPLATNPVALVSLPKLPASRERRLEGDELHRLFEACAKGHARFLRPIVELAIETGMRRSEIVSVRWTDVDLKNGLLHLPMTKNGHPRSVPLTPRAVSILGSLTQTGDRVFPITTNALRLAWERLRRRAGVVGLRFHDLRHEAITRFIEMGLSVPEVALISGHRDLRMLWRYTHLRPAALVTKLAAKSCNGEQVGVAGGASSQPFLE